MSNLQPYHFLPSEILEREVHRRGDLQWLRWQLSTSAQFIFVSQPFAIGWIADDDSWRPFGRREICDVALSELQKIAHAGGTGVFL